MNYLGMSFKVTALGKILVAHFALIIADQIMDFFHMFDEASPQNKDLVALHALKIFSVILCMNNFLVTNQV